MSDILFVILGTTMLYVAATSRLEGYVKALAFQGLLLFILVILESPAHSLFETVFLSVETLGIKTVVIPLILTNLIRKSGIRREIEPYIPQLFSLIIASLVFVFGFLVAWWSQSTGLEIEHLAFGVAIAIVISGLILVLTRKKIVTHILAYIMIENGIFLLSLSVSGEMPFIVNLGVLLDIFVAVYLFVIFSNRIQRAYDEDHIDALQNLKD